MGALFGTTEKAKTVRVREDTVERLTGEVEKLSMELAELVPKRDELQKELGLSERVKELMEQVTALEISLSKKEEEHAREQREIEHKLGLHKTQVEAEREQAVTEAKLAVREENLAAEKDQIKSQMEFQRASMEREMEASRELMNQILSRLPDVSWAIRENRGAVPELASGNGNGEDEEQ